MTSAYVGSSTRKTEDSESRRANPLGAYITTLGAIITLVAVWLDWITLGPGESEENASSGYEADGVIPFMGYLGIAFAVALLYATKRADRRQHRGLSLASMAVGLASLLWTLSFLIDPISTVQYNENVTIEVGVWVALIGTLIWTFGSLWLAKEPEGDVDHDSYVPRGDLVTINTPATSHRGDTDRYAETTEVKRAP